MKSQSWESWYGIPEEEVEKRKDARPEEGDNAGEKFDAVFALLLLIEFPCD